MDIIAETFRSSKLVLTYVLVLYVDGQLHLVGSKLAMKL
jgi:hypothetical protein